MQPELKYHPKLFWLIFLFLGINLLSASMFIVLIPPLRYARQPSILLGFLFLYQYFAPATDQTKGLSRFRNFFWFFAFYLCFNIITSLDVVNSLTYAAWLVAMFIFLWTLFINRNQLSFRNTLYNFAFAGGVLGGIILIVSYIGGYVLNINYFFDERYNYTLGMMKTEFSGIFGSNNTLGVVSFLTFSFLLMLSVLVKKGKQSNLFLAGALFITFLIFSIGNRSSMACCFSLWLLYFVYVRASVLGLVLMSMVMFGGSIAFRDQIFEKLRLEQFEGGNVLGNRSELVGEALEITENMNFFGVGYHNQRLSRKYYRLVAENDKEYNFHNTYLAVVTELGWLGLLWVPGIILYGILLFRTRNPDPLHKRPMRILMATLLALSIFYLPVEDSVNSPGSAIFIAFWMMFLIMLVGKTEKAESLS